ncbi:MAG: hypothetical protein CFE43_01675 [Burkholderiales bacterium PBB3]|nr:MAG: hypothetical protein CFE43_01675 [Burkholderiales bacterium PBB3]
MSALHHLIADPSPAVQTFIRNLLESYGFDAASIKTVSTPQAALEVAADIKPDFLLTDWFGKEALNGIDLHEAVLRHNPACALAVMAAAPTPQQQQQVDADMAGAYFLLAKPFTADEFRSTLATAMGELAKKHPHIADQVAAQARGATKVAKMVMPDLPQHKPGDQVSYQNRRESVKHVILRRGELVVQLHGIPGQIEASKLKRM